MQNFEQLGRELERRGKKRVLPGIGEALETEDLLVLAVLLLAMKQDGSDKLELMIAAALYLLL